jgi:hypothetical protein
VSGTVGNVLALTLAPAANLGAFTPGVTQNYDSTVAATVLSSAGDAALSVSDPSTTAPGHLVNGTVAMPQALQAKATNAANPNSAFAPIGANPVTLLTYTGPTTNDQVMVSIRQRVASTDGLRTGEYSKTLTFTLSTTTP